jgi:hypothetical protein
MESTEIILEENEPQKHLFICSIDLLSANHLHSCFKKCDNVSILEQDGELLFSPTISPPPVFENPNFFIKDRELLESGDDLSWSNNALQWQNNWDKVNPNASLRVGRSIYDFMRPHILLDYFTNAGFLIVVKNPYAIVEDILALEPSLEYELEDVANHVLHSLIIQRKNNYLIGNNFSFTYEDMLNKPEWVQEQIREKYGVKDFELDFKFAPSNEEQINKLTDFQIEVLNDVFVKARDTLKYWGYDLVSRQT